MNVIHETLSSMRVTIGDRTKSGIFPTFPRVLKLEQIVL